MDPKFQFVNPDSVPWEESERMPGVEKKSLGTANGSTMELYKFPPNTTYPDHFHEGPEFVYMLSGRARQGGQWLEEGWASVGETGSLDKDFLSGEQGCVLLTVYGDARYVDGES